MPMHELTSLALLLKKSSWCMTYAIPVPEYMIFLLNLIISFGPSGHFLSYEQLIQLVAAFPLCSFISVPPAVSKLPGLIWERNGHHVPRQHEQLKLALCYATHSESTTFLLLLVHNTWIYCLKMITANYLLYPQLKPAQICSNCLTTV